MRYRYGQTADGTPEQKAIVYTQNEHRIKLADVDRDAVYLTSRLQMAGYETYIVGGAVRDLILGKKPKDFDIASAASPQQIKKILRNARIIGRRFRLVHVIYGEKIIEVATFRSCKDGNTGNAFGTIDEDVRRRDFSANALFYDPQQQLVIDYVGGVKDIFARRLHSIIPLEVIFTDDPVRMIRAVKYAVSCGLKIPLNMQWKIKNQGPLLAGISDSRLTEEIAKIIKSGSSGRIIEALEKMNLYEYLQPAASRLFKSDAVFKRRYLERFKALSAAAQEIPLSGALQALYRDYVEALIDWEKSAADSYNSVYTKVRQFILPMNPPHADLERSLKTLFRDHGISVTKSYYANRPFRRRHRAAGPAPSP